MRGFGGRTSSLLANYDQSLLVLTLSALAGGDVDRRRCTAVPWRTVDVQDLPSSLRAYVAAGNLALIDAKLRDDVDDGGRWYAGIARWLLRRRTGKAHRALGALGFDLALVSSLPSRARAGVRAPAAELEQLAEPSAALLGAVFAHGARLADAPEREADARRFGEALARAVYGLDALEDHDEDLAHRRFNAAARLAARAGREPAVRSVHAFVQRAAVAARQAAAGLLPADRQRIVGEILLQLVQRADGHRDRLLGVPAQPLARAAEAGICECACEGCEGCSVCEGVCAAGEGGGACVGCCDVCCCWTEQAQLRRQRRRSRSAG